MPRSCPFSHTCFGRHVGYSLIKLRNDPTYTVYYRNQIGERRKRDTNQTGMEKAKLAAHAIIEEEYAPHVRVEMVTWDEAVQRIKERASADGLRGPSVDYYCKLVRRIRTFYRGVDGPADI